MNLISEDLQVIGHVKWGRPFSSLRWTTIDNKVECAHMADI